MSEFTKENLAERLKEKVSSGDTHVPEDMMRALAAHFGVDVEAAAPAAPDTSGGYVKGAAQGPGVDSEPSVNKDDAGDSSEEESVEEGYESQTVEELKEECRSRDLPVSGTKAELVERLEADDADEGEEGGDE